MVTNHQALGWVYQCCQMVLPETKPGEWEAKASDAPGTGGQSSYMHLNEVNK
jgi:hypothetical protein